MPTEAASRVLVPFTTQQQKATECSLRVDLDSDVEVMKHCMPDVMYTIAEGKQKEKMTAKIKHSHSPILIPQQPDALKY